MDLALTILASAASLALLGLWWWRQRCENAGLRRLLDRVQAEKLSAEEQQRQAVADALAQRAALIHSMGEGVLLLDGDGRIQLCNQAFERFFDVKGEILGRRVLEALRSHELDELVRRTHTSGQVMGAELELRGLEPRSLQVNAASITGGREQGMILVFHDLTRVRQLENTRKDFVADVSHELRTPLTTVQGNLDLLRRGAAEDPDTRTTTLRAIADETARMRRLVNDLLLLAQADAGLKLYRQPVELDTLLLEVYRQAQVMAQGVTVRLGAEDQALVLGDADRLRQLLLNLVDNALKHVVSGSGEVTLTLRRAGGWVQVGVEDNGTGISPEDLPHIFERFYRADLSRSRPGGSGLGLAIAKWVAEAHGGRIEVESQAGRGSTFTLWLPELQAGNGQSAIGG